MNNDNNTIEIDGDHPWVQAAASMNPIPLPCALKIDPVELPGKEEGTKTRAGMVTMVTGAGVMTCFVSPGAISQFVNQAADVLAWWQNQEKMNGGLIVADKNMEQQAKQAADAQNHLRSI